MRSKPLLYTLAVVLALAGLATAPLPVPLEIPLLGGSAACVLRASPRARRVYVRSSRRWPRAFAPFNRVLRRSKPAGATVEAKMPKD